MKKVFSTVCVLLLVLILVLTACTPQQPADGNELASEKSKFDGEVRIGVIAARTGTSILSGTMNVHAAEAAASQINEAGGILGKEIVLVIEDEIDSLQTSVNATAKLLENKELACALGSQYSQRVLAAMDTVDGAGIPFFTFGSSQALLDAGSEWLWMMRVADSFTGKGMAEFVYNSLECKNPAIMYTSDAFGEGLFDVIVDTLEGKNLKVNKDLCFGVASDETNMTPQLAQIVNSNADCFIAIGSGPVAPYIVNQAADAGISIPCVGSMSFANQNAFTQCGNNTDGWYSLCEWTTDVAHAESQNYMDYVMENYGSLETTGQPGAYDAVWVFKAACEKAGTTTDHDAINAAISNISGLTGACGALASKGSHCLCTELVVTQNKDLKATVIDRITVR